MKKSEARMTFIFITILLDAIGIGLIVPILPEVIRRFGTDEAFVSSYFGYFISIYSLMLFLASPFLGSLSDRFGRRPVLLVALFGSGIDYLLMAFSPSLLLLFIGRIISGLTGASLTVASSYIADISNDKNRTANFGLVGAAFGIGFVVGPALGGLVGSYGHHLPFIVAAILTLSNFVFGLFVLPESLIKEKRKDKIDFSQMNPFKSVFKVLFQSKGTTLIWAFFLTNLAGQSHPSIWALYTHYKFGWNSLQIGLSLTVVGLAFGMGQGLSTRFITTKIGEYRSVIYGSCVLILAFLLYGIVEKAWMIYAVTSLLLFTGITMPSLQSLITKDGDAGLQGELQGTLVSLTSLTAILGPLIYTNLFAYYTHREAGNIPGAPYYAAALITGLCLLLMFFRRNSKTST